MIAYIPCWRDAINVVLMGTKKMLVVEEPALVGFDFEEVGEVYYTYTSFLLFMGSKDLLNIAEI